MSSTVTPVGSITTRMSSAAHSASSDPILGLGPDPFSMSRIVAQDSGETPMPCIDAVASRRDMPRALRMRLTASPNVSLLALGNVSHERVVARDQEVGVRDLELRLAAQFAPQLVLVPA